MADSGNRWVAPGRVHSCTMQSSLQCSNLGQRGWPGFWGEPWTRNQDICSITTFRTISPCPFLPRLLKQLPDACPQHPLPLLQSHHTATRSTFQSYDMVLLLPFIKSSVVPQCPGVKVLPPYLAYSVFHILTTQTLLFFSQSLLFAPFTADLLEFFLNTGLKHMKLLIFDQNHC